MSARFVAVALVLLGAVACASPEATRRRAGGPGADVGNRTTVVEMHAGSRPYYRTPGLVGDYGMDDLAPARQAQQLSARTGREAR